MATCLKTGIDVFIIEYNATVRAAHGEWSRYVQRLIRADLAQRAQGADHAQL